MIGFDCHGCRHACCAWHRHTPKYEYEVASDWSAGALLHWDGQDADYVSAGAKIATKKDAFGQDIVLKVRVEGGVLEWGGGS